MVAAELLKLRRRYSIIAIAAFFTIGVVIVLYLRASARSNTPGKRRQETVPRRPATTSSARSRCCRSSSAR